MSLCSLCEKETTDAAVISCVIKKQHMFLSGEIRNAVPFSEDQEAEGALAVMPSKVGSTTRGVRKRSARDAERS